MRQLPELLFVKPIGGGQHKIEHTHVVFSVEEWDANGIPRKLTLRGGDEVMDVAKIQANGIEFVTGYIQAINLEPHPERANKKALSDDLTPD